MYNLLFLEMKLILILLIIVKLGNSELSEIIQLEGDSYDCNGDAKSSIFYVEKGKFFKINFTNYDPWLIRKVCQDRNNETAPALLHVHVDQDNKNDNIRKLKADETMSTNWECDVNLYNQPTLHHFLCFKIIVKNKQILTDENNQTVLSNDIQSSTNPPQSYVQNEQKERDITSLLPNKQLENLEQAREIASSGTENNRAWVLPTVAVLIIILCVLLITIVKKNNIIKFIQGKVKSKTPNQLNRDDTYSEVTKNIDSPLISPQHINVMRDYAVPINIRVDDVTYIEPYKPSENLYSVPIVNSPKALTLTKDEAEVTVTYETCTQKVDAYAVPIPKDQRSPKNIEESCEDLYTYVESR